MRSCWSYGSHGLEHEGIAERPGDARAGIRATYRKALVRHLRNPGETILGRAYELGRDAIARGESLLDTVSVHQHILRAEPSIPCKDLSSASDFLLEALSPFEMTHRGFRDAVRAPRQTNETLEEQMKHLAYACTTRPANY